MIQELIFNLYVLIKDSYKAGRYFTSLIPRRLGLPQCCTFSVCNIENNNMGGPGDEAGTLPHLYSNHCLLITYQVPHYLTPLDQYVRKNEVGGGV